MTFDLNILELRDKYEAHIEDLKHRHQEELENLLRSQEGKFQNLFSYFLRGKILQKNMEIALKVEIEKKENWSKTKDILEKTLKEKELTVKVQLKMVLKEKGAIKTEIEEIQKEIQQGVKERVGEESEKRKEKVSTNKKLTVMTKNEELKSRIEKNALELSKLKKKFSTQLKEHVLKQARLQHEFLAWKNEVKQEILASKLASSLKERMEPQEEEMREEINKEMMEFILRQRNKWEKEIESKKKEVKQEAEFTERKKSEVDSMSEACFECDEAVKAIKVIERYLEKRQKLKLYKREHACLIEKFKRIDPHHKAGMKDTKRLLTRLHEPETSAVLELKDQYFESGTKMQADALSRVKESHLTAAATMTTMKANAIEEFRSKSKTKMRVLLSGQVNESTIKAAEQVMDILAKRLITPNSAAFEELKTKCKKKIRVLLSGQVDNYTIKAVEQVVDILARMLVTSVFTPYSAASTPKSNYDDKTLHIKIDEHSKRKTRICKHYILNGADHQAEHPHSHQLKDNSSGKNHEHPQLDNVVLFEDTFYHTPSSSNQSSPAAQARARARTRHHVDLPKTPCSECELYSIVWD